MQKKQWIIQPADGRAAGLAGELKVSPVLAQLLINRGVTDVHGGSVFLRPRLTALIPPHKMPGVADAVRRIKQAVKDKEKIIVYGDYDVDGITGVAILWQILKLLGAEVDYYIPHRIDEGYGLNEEAVRLLAKDGAKLLITVDCGISAIRSAELAAELGLELVITDHHQIADKLPKAAAIVHPATDATYGNQDSSGSMVAFKLVWALADDFSAGKRMDPKLHRFMLDATSLAAMGTVADVMDLRGENRVLVSYGLRMLSECKLCGVMALIESNGLTGKGLDSFHIGFRLAPVLNAAGRMGHARLAVDLLTTENTIHAQQIAQYLKEQNNQRRLCEQKIFKEACGMMAERGLDGPDRKSVVLASPDWHTGVIGIVASRMVGKYHRPAIMINTSETKSQGSGRSIAGFDLLKAIGSCGSHLIAFGGHKMAAGITIETAKIERFADDFEEYARQNLTQDDIVDRLYIDAQVPLAKFRKEVVTELQLLGPFGQGNPEPVFATKGVRLSAPPRKVGTNGEHLQLAVTDNTASVRCIGFGMGGMEKKLLEKDFFNVAYEPQINTYSGVSSVQLVLKDIQFG